MGERSDLGGTEQPRGAVIGRLDGKRVLISGTGRGMGRVAALLFAEEGARVACCDLDAEAQEETIQLIRDAGHEVATMAPVDLGEEAGAREWVDRSVDELGGIDVLYNNAGAVRLGDFASLPADDWYFTIRNELHIVHFSTIAAWRHFEEGGGGSIVNVGSIAGSRGFTSTFSEMAAHGATKGGVKAYTFHLAATGGPHGIRANVIEPGLIRTPETEPLFEGEDAPAAQLVRRAPAGRPGDPADIVHVALFLASDESAYVNGAEIRVDGGLAMVVV